MTLLIAVDGPAASGKGTVAGRLAEVYGLPYLDTGLLYRAVARFAALALPAGERLEDGRHRIDASGPEFKAAAIGAALALDPRHLGDPELRSGWVGEWASRAAAVPEVREILLHYQTAYARRPEGAVLDGRDIGTVIAPEAPAKLFVTARAEVRAERRWRQLAGQGEAVALEDVLADIRRRDERDSGRASAPLVQAPDAVLLDTSEMDISTSVEAACRIVEAARGRWANPG